MEMPDIINKINELNAIKKERELSSTELEELSNYRKMYLYYKLLGRSCV